MSYATNEIPIYTVGSIEKASNLPVYDSIDSDVIQSYMEYSLASLIYYCLKEGACSEQSSRMTAMDNSSKNAGKKMQPIQSLYQVIFRYNHSTNLLNNQ